MEELRTELASLQTMIKEYFEFKQKSTNFYGVEHFINLDTELYKRYAEIQKKFVSLGELYEREKTLHQNALTSNANRNQKVLENVDFRKPQERDILKEKTDKQELKLSALLKRMIEVTRAYNGTTLNRKTSISSTTHN